MASLQDTNLVNAWGNSFSATSPFWVSSNERGLLRGVRGRAIVIDGLWALAFGNDGRGGVSDTLYFSAGPADESQGLFGSLTPVRRHHHPGDQDRD